MSSDTSGAIFFFNQLSFLLSLSRLHLFFPPLCTASPSWNRSDPMMPQHLADKSDGEEMQMKSVHNRKSKNMKKRISKTKCFNDSSWQGKKNFVSQQALLPTLHSCFCLPLSPRMPPPHRRIWNWTVGSAINTADGAQPD